MDDVEKFEKLDRGMFFINIFIQKIYECLFLYLFKKKNSQCLFLSLFKIKNKKLNVLDSWHMYCFILQVTFCVFHFSFVELVSDITFSLELDMLTPTPIEVDD